jgi:hypothetical protein
VVETLVVFGYDPPCGLAVAVTAATASVMPVVGPVLRGTLFAIDSAARLVRWVRDLRALALNYPWHRFRWKASCDLPNAAKFLVRSGGLEPPRG